MPQFDDDATELTTAAAPSAPLLRVRLLVAYDGGQFHGFAQTPGVATVGGSLRAALEQILRIPVVITQAGRTDAGVHGWGQVVTFDAPVSLVDLPRLVRGLNGLCGPHIVVRDAAVVDTTVNARFSAQWRQYRYHVLTTSDANPFLAATTWHVPGPLDLAAMTMACDPLIGEHDFTSLCRKPVVKPGRLVPTMRRRVLSAAWSTVEGGPHEVDGLLRFEIRATAFCHQMVRSIVGLHVDIGRGRRHAGEVMGVLRARDRAAGSPVAPPQGLCLWEVGY